MSYISRQGLEERFRRIRSFTEQLCEPLEIEDYVIQSMSDASPVRWHLAHTAWFFETFLLRPLAPGYETPDERYNYLFNSYYNAVGGQFPRPRRGLLSRPTVEQIYAYRHHVDREMLRLLGTLDDRQLNELAPLLELGLNHEQQHQELLLTDIKHAFYQNPLYPAYTAERPKEETEEVQKITWIEFPGGEVTVGFNGTGFSFDNETPAHTILQSPFLMADRLITNGEYLSFMKDGGYSEPLLWLSDGWNLVNQENWCSPLYWVKQDDQWFEFTLSGLLPLELDRPVCHISYYEADAFAAWSQARLPTEFEWEFAARGKAIEGNFIESEHYHPIARPRNTEHTLTQMYGDVWEWTRSPYTPYPGFKAARGAVGEYNGKFMSSQMVLKGGSCVSSKSHLRATYRNFFHPHSRWQFMGLRLARAAGNTGREA